MTKHPLQDREDLEGASMAIVILGAAVWQGEKASPTLARRIQEGARQARIHPHALIIASGGLGKFPPSEAAVMKRDLVETGIEESRIVLEDKSTNTLQNLRNSIQIMQAHNRTKAIVVTDAYHVPRSVLSFRLLGMDAVGCSAPYDGNTPFLRQARYWIRELLAIPVYVFKIVRGRR